MLCNRRKVFHAFLCLVAQRKGMVIKMNDKYLNEARFRWGATDVYREHEQKTKNYTKEKWAEANDGMMAIFAEFAACKDSGVRADSAEHKGLLPSFRRTSPPITTPARTRSLQGLAKCMSPMSGSRRTSISTEMELQNLQQRG